MAQFYHGRPRQQGASYGFLYGEIAEQSESPALLRRIEQAVFDAPTVLLWSEPKPDRCHGRLVAEYLRRAWAGVTITHL